MLSLRCSRGNDFGEITKSIALNFNFNFLKNHKEQNIPCLYTLNIPFLITVGKVGVGRGVGSSGGKQELLNKPR